MSSRSRKMSLLLGVVLLAGLLAAPRGQAYIDTPPITFGVLCKASHGVAVLKVSRTDAERSGVVLEKDRDIKGKFPAEKVGLILRNRVGNMKEDNEKEDKAKEEKDVKTVGKILGGLEKGAEVPVFYLQNVQKPQCAAYFYLGSSWYFSMIDRGDSGPWTGSGAPIPVLLGVFAGCAGELPGLAKDVLDGKEVVVPSRIGTQKELAAGEGKRVRLRASLKLLDRDLKRDVVEEKSEPKK